MPAVFMSYKLLSCIVYSVMRRTARADSVMTDNKAEKFKFKGFKPSNYRKLGY
jgi:hypothetical protein